ncbi:DUF72 domain-containing protein [Pendulispora albinea]|uniref:DUF72 domain-containing protein n=1 Tax=Pendulispora albinea TaxID=2741071 RepID=A0ABZ2LSB6_9BACT
MAHARELAFASRAVDSIEVNGSFYSLLRPESVARWHAETPPDFVFAVKGSRFITHMKRLTNVETALANFFGSGILALEEKLGPILWQLPPSMPFDRERLSHFFELLPRTMKAAAALAQHHDERLEGRAHVTHTTNHPLRYALEIRHPSFHHPDFIALLRRHRIALCVADTAGRFPDFEDVTAGFVYVRLHGDEKLYESGYTPQSLSRWAHRIEAWRRGTELQGARRASPAPAPSRTTGRDVYVYFDNDAKVHAPFDAQSLRDLLHRAAA